MKTKTKMKMKTKIKMKAKTKRKKKLKYYREARRRSSRRTGGGGGRGDNASRSTAEKLLPAWLTGFIEEKPFYILRTRIASTRWPQRRAFSGFHGFHRSSPPSSSSSPAPCSARVVGGTKPPEIARVVLWPGGGAILYHWVLSFMGEKRVRIVLAAR